MTKKFLLAITIITGLFIASSAFADTSPRGCETNTMKNSFYCSWLDGGKSWCGGSQLTCQVEPTAACPSNPSNGTYSFSCNSCACVLSCTGGYTVCGGNSCVANCTPGANCTACDTCTSNNCTACEAGYELISGSCVAAPIKLSSLSNVGGFIKQVTSPTLTLDSVGNLTPSGDLQLTSNKSIALTAVGTTSLWFGNYNGATPFAYGTGDVASIAVEGDVKGNRLCFQDDCRADWASIGGGSLWSRTAPFLYPSTLTDSIGIGTSTPATSLEIFKVGTPELRITDGANAVNLGDVQTLISFYGKWNASFPIVNSAAIKISKDAASGSGGTAMSFFTQDNSSTTISEKMRINRFGNVGVGTTAPFTKLDVISSATGPYLGLRVGFTGTNKGAFIGQVSTSGYYSYIGSSYYYNAGSWRSPSTTGTAIRFNDNGGIGMFTDSGLTADTNYTPTERMTILSGGNIGIGAVSPNDLFSIGNAGSAAPAGSSNTGHNYTNTYLSSDSYALTNYGLVNTLIGAATSTLANSNLWYGTKNGNIWNGDAGAGNVGIGTTTPQAKLSVIGTSYLSGQITNASLSGSGQRCLYVDATGNIFAKTADCGTATSTGDNLGNSIADRNIQLGNYWLSGDGGSEGVFVKADGNVGIGTTNPGSKLEITGSATQANALFSVVNTASDTFVGDFSLLNPNLASGQVAYFAIGKAASTNNRFSISYNHVADGSPSNYMGYGVNGGSSAIMSLLASGNVGIGTTAPGAKLEVFAGSQAQIARFNGSVQSLGIAQADSNVTGVGPRSYVIGSNFTLDVNNVPVVSGQVNYLNGYAISFGQNSWTTDSGLAFWSGTGAGGLMTEKMRIMNSGNVGIGTTAPNDRFSIGNAGSAPAGSSNTGHNFTSTYLSSDDYALANYGVVKTLIASATSSSALWGGTVGGSVWNLNSVNVGIGTTTPGWKFHVVTSVAVPAAMIEGTGHTLGLKAATPYAEFFNISNTRLGWFGYGVNATDLYFANETATGPLYFSTNGYANRRMTIDATGNVGIGVTNPISRLDVSGAIRAYGVGNAGRITAQDTNGGGASISIDPQFSTGVPGIGTNGAFPITFNTNFAERMRITSTGNVGIGTTNPLGTLHVSNASSTNALVVANTGLVGVGASPASATLNIGRINNNYNLLLSGVTDGVTAFAVGGGSTNMLWTSRAGYFDIETNTAGKGLSLHTTGGQLLIDSTGNVGIGTTAPNDRFSIGNAGSAPAGSSNTGHNYTNTYLSSDDYALTNYGIVKTLIAAATSTMPSGGTNFWGGAMNGNIWNGDAGAGNVGIGTTNPTKKLTVSGDALINGVTVGRGGANISSNLAIGNGALLSNTTGFQSVAIGESAMQANLTGEANVSIGSGSLLNNTGGSYNVALGMQALNSNVSGSNNIAIGANALQGGDNSGNVIVGTNIGVYGFGDYNTVVGNEAGYNVGGASNNNTLLGYQAGYNIGGSNNVFLGNYAGYYESGSNVLFIDNQTRASEADARTKALIYGTFDASPANQKLAINGNVGIGTSTPVKKLDVWGDAILNASAHTTLLTFGFSTNGTAYHQITSNRSTGELAIEAGVGGSGHFLTFSSDNGTERMRINAAGNVGISTTNPGAKIDIVGAANGGGLNLRTLGDVMIGTGAGSSIFFDGNYSYASGNYIRSIAANTQGFYTAGAERIRITAAGNVGIGITAPNDNFSIGNGGTSAPAGSSNTGHNYTSTYLSTDNYALANYGIVKTLIGSATSTLGTNFLPLAGGTMSGDVNFGARNITNLNNLTVTKITATTIDPLYTINDVNYSTFAPSIAGGVKEEYVGKADIKRLNSSLNEYEYIVNFALEDEGSDLWLWHKVVDYTNDNVQVFITPAGKFAEVYYQIENNKLIFRSDKPVEISYRLIGNRYDWQAWPTRAHDQVEKGVIIK